MTELHADKANLTVCRRELLTSGGVNAAAVRFTFSEDWAGLERTAVFRAGPVSRSVRLDERNTCAVPWEVLERHGPRLECGVCGRRGETLVLPTLWADLGTILEGAAPGEAARPPTPDLWEQALGRKADALDYTAAGDLGLYAGNTLLSAVPIPGGGGEGGTADHRLLTHRDAETQHPVSAIDGLEEELRRIPPPAEAITNLELEELLK